MRSVGIANSSQSKTAASKTATGNLGVLLPNAMIVQPELPWSFFNNFRRLIPNGGRPSEKVDRPAGELIDQPHERLERLSDVRAAFAFFGPAVEFEAEF
jgi:hypothetical protein